MINFLYRLFLTFNSTSLIIVLFLVKEQVTIQWHNKLSYVPDFVSYTLYFCLPIIFTFISLLLAKSLANDSLEKTEKNIKIENGREKTIKISKIIEVEQANNAFLPSYLGYFFVALSVPYFETLIFVFLVLFLFTFFSQTLYFNPLFLLFGYHFYYLTTINKTRIFLITRKSLKNPDDINLPKLRRINDFTFIDLGR
ncbi:hypothetical protein GH885_09690 [Gracilibacillus thailandensis]|uniref:Uncharacterized protein n=1 Tax=Gracilibacillus thailandensis TaxID=563735 RepID=A0A6N7R262_9BACI|nr:hypothetical protein [Gracilibacillus thailandensis]